METISLKDEINQLEDLLVNSAEYLPEGFIMLLECRLNGIREAAQEAGLCN